MENNTEFDFDDLGPTLIVDLKNMTKEEKEKELKEFHKREITPEEREEIRRIVENGGIVLDYKHTRTGRSRYGEKTTN